MKQNIKRDRTSACTLISCTSIKSIFNILLYISIYSTAEGLPVQLDNSINAIDDIDSSNSTETLDISIDTTQWPTPLSTATSSISSLLPHSTRITYMIKPQVITSKEWMKLVNRGPLITQLAFDIGPKFTPTFAYVTKSSYDKFVDDLEEKCRKPIEENIADVRVDNLNNEYFRWEEFQFNKALLKTLFPETSQKNHSRFLSSDKIIRQIRLNNELESQCKIVEQNSDEWSKRVDENTQFEDYLINRIFQPRLSGEEAQIVIEEEGNYSDDEPNQRNRRDLPSYLQSDPYDLSYSNTTSYSTILSRKRTSTRNLSRQQLEQIARLRFHEYKAKQRKA